MLPDFDHSFRRRVDGPGPADSWYIPPGQALCRRGADQSGGRGAIPV